MDSGNSSPFSPPPNRPQCLFNAAVRETVMPCRFFLLVFITSDIAYNEP